MVLKLWLLALLGKTTILISIGAFHGHCALPTCHHHVNHRILSHHSLAPEGTDNTIVRASSSCLAAHSSLVRICDDVCLARTHSRGRRAQAKLSRHRHRGRGDVGDIDSASPPRCHRHPECECVWSGAGGSGIGFGNAIGMGSIHSPTTLSRQRHRFFLHPKKRRRCRVRALRPAAQSRGAA